MDSFYLWLIPSCVGIAFIDMLLFGKWLRCEFCGRPRQKDFVFFLLPTVLEILLFLAGVAIGRS